MKAAQAQSRSRQAGVLVVDDDHRVRQLCARTLRLRGYNVLEASGGWEALQLMSDHAAEIDIVVTDIVMPDLDGVELVSRLRAHHPNLAIILMSGYAPAELLRRGAIADTFPLLRKPFVIDQLYGTVRKLLDEIPPAS